MLPWKVHQIGLKRIFKKLIFTAVECKNPVCDSTNISAHVHLSEHTTPVELLPQPCRRYSTWQLWKINGHIYKMPRLLNWIEINLFANMCLDLIAITYSYTDSVWVLTASWHCSASSAWSKIMVFWLVAFYVFTIISLFCPGFPHF